MKVEGDVKNNRLQLLIDSGSTHNFLNDSTTDKIGCRTMEVPLLKVLRANDSEMACNQVCKDFKRCMHGQQFTINVFFLPLENYHMVWRV